MLRKIPLFSALDDKSLRHLENVAVKRNHPKNVILISKGDDGDEVFVVLTGHLKLAIADSSGREIIIGMLGPGDYFGEISLIDGESRSATIMTT